LVPYFDDWESKHGDLTAEELARATKDLTPPHSKNAKTLWNEPTGRSIILLFVNAIGESGEAE